MSMGLESVRLTSFPWETLSCIAISVSDWYRDIRDATLTRLELQWNSVIMYPQGDGKTDVLTKVRSIQNAIFPTGRIGSGSTCSREQSAMEDSSPSWMLFITRFSYCEIAFQGSVSLKTCREIEIETERLDDMLVFNQRKGKKVLLEGKLVRNIRYCATFCTSYSKKKCTFPFVDVRDRRVVRYNQVYVLSRVRTNRVSL